MIRYCYAIAVALWLASLALPAVDVNATMHLAGHRVFIIGIDALSTGIPGWLANPFALAAVTAGLFGRFGIATALAGCASLLSLSSYLAPAMARADGFPVDEVVFKVGFFLWLAACSLIFATSLFALIRARRTGASR